MRWTLLGLARHRHRQLWVAEVLRTRLDTDLETLARCGTGGHPRNHPGHGEVPGLPDWTYSFHGRGCVLTHRHTAEAIDVDFLDDSGEDFDSWFYGRYLDSLGAPERPEAKVLSLHPSRDTLGLTLRALGESGLLIPSTTGRAASRLHPGIIEDEASLPAIAEVDFPLAGAQRALWLRNLLQRGETAAAVTAYAELDPPDLVEVLDQVLTEPISGRTSAAFHVVCARGDVARVQRLLTRLDPKGEIPHPYLWDQATKWLRSNL
ncbi:MAG: hypothetical protein ABMA64_10645 [Myxococcota bacterium]